MSQNVPPQLEGHIDAPNPLELFWEKNKRIVTFGAIAAVIAIGLNYVIQYQQRRAVAERWSAFAQASGLDAAYTETGARWSEVQTTLTRFEQMAEGNPNMAQQLLAQRQRTIQNFFQELQLGLVSELDEGVEKADATGLQQIVDAKDGRSPLALWVLANRAYLASDYDVAVRHLQALSSDYPNHFLCRVSDYPVQWRPEVEKDDPEEEDPKTTRRNQKTEYEPPVAGSSVSLLLARIEKERAFRGEHPEFYTAKEPTSAETVVFEIDGAGTVKIKLFSDLVPKHAARFLELAREGWWTGQRIHEIRREGSQSSFGVAPNELAFGWKSTVDNDDRATWEAGEVDEADLIDWEGGPLSHFPGTVAVEPATDGKSQVERIMITGGDTAERDDGNRVIIGRVIEGLDVVRDIIDGGFADAAEAERGIGKPEGTYTIKSVKVE